MYLTDHYPPPGSMGSMGPYQYAHPGADYTGAAGYKMDYTKAGAEYGRAPCSYDGMPPMMAHPGLDYDFTRLDIYGRAKQGRAKGNGQCPLHVDLSSIHLTPVFDVLRAFTNSELLTLNHCFSILISLCN